MVVYIHALDLIRVIKSSQFKSCRNTFCPICFCKLSNNAASDGSSPLDLSHNLSLNLSHNLNSTKLSHNIPIESQATSNTYLKYWFRIFICHTILFVSSTCPKV